MLGFQRAIIFLHHQLADRVHEAGVAVDFSRIGEILGDHEMQVAFQRVPEDDAFVVAVVAQQHLQVKGRIGQRRDREGDVLDQHRGACTAHGTHCRESALADLPVHVAGRRVGRELHRLDRGDTLHRRQHGSDLAVDARAVGGADFDQQRRRLFAQFADHRRQARLVFDRVQRWPVEQFDGGDRLWLEADDGFAGRTDVWEEHQCRSFARVFDNGLVGDPGNEAKGALGADHQMSEDVEGVFVIDQRIEAVAGGVLDLELVADAFGQLGVVACVAAQAFQFAKQDGVGFGKGIAAQRVLGIEHGAVGQHHAQAGQRLVAVLRGAAAHAGGVVGGNAANFGRADGCRVRPDFFAMRRQPTIDLAPDDPRPDAHFLRIGRQLVGGKAFTDQRQNAVTDRLPGEAGAGRTESHRRPVGVGCGQHGFGVVFGFDDRDHLRNQPVEAGVGAIRQTAQFVGDDLVFGKGLPEGLDEVGHSVWGSVNSSGVGFRLAGGRTFFCFAKRK